MIAVRRLPIVGVIGSGLYAHRKRATEIGDWLATQNVHLLTGAGGGAMAAVCEAFSRRKKRKGRIIGIVPCLAKNAPTTPKVGYPNRFVEIPIFTHLHLSGASGAKPLSRNHIVVLSSAVLIALPGGPGTASEVRLAVKYQRPIIAYLRNRSEIPGLPASVIVESGFERVKEFVRAALGRR